MADDTKAIFITGGASGIGRAVAKRFAAEGWRIGLADVDVAGLDDTAAMLPKGCARCHVMDVRDRAAWAAELDAFADHGGGRLDVLFNNAGIAAGGPFAESEPDELERVVQVNIMGVVNGARAGFAMLRDTPGSCLLNTASAAGIYGVSGAAIYSASKFAVRGLTEALDGEWAEHGIRVRSLMPGFIDTPLLDAGVAASNETVREQVKAAGLEFTPVETVADKAWEAVHGDTVHTLVGKTARRMKFAARWMPRSLRKQMRRGLN